MASEDQRARADEAVAKRFSRVMCAATSPIGMLSDPPLIGIACALSIPAAMALELYGDPSIDDRLLVGLALAPLLFWALVTFWVVRGARARVVDWLAGLPFEVGNINGLLNGVAYNLEVRFAAQVPDREVLNQALEAAHPDCFALEYSDDEPVVPIRIGVPDSKLNPVRASYRRYLRARALVDQGLIPLSERYPIEEVWVR